MWKHGDCTPELSSGKIDELMQEDVDSMSSCPPYLAHVSPVTCSLRYISKDKALFFRP